MRSVIAEIFAALRIPPCPGLQWSPDQRTDEWVGTPIVRITGKTAAEAIPIVRTWTKNNVLVKGEYKHPKSYKMHACVTLNETKAAEILGPLYFWHEANDP